MQNSSGKIIAGGCLGIVSVFLLAASAGIWFVFSRVQDAASDTVRGYEIRNGKVVYKTGWGGFGMPQTWEVKGADVKTFQKINDNYGRDENHSFADGFVIPNSDGLSFEVIRKPFAKDRNHVFYERGVLSDSPATFKILISNTANAFSTDGKQVYYGNKPQFPGTLDASTFERIGETNFYRDKNRVYLIYNRQEIVADADPATFKIASDYSEAYATDKKNVYFGGVKVANCDVKTHEILNRDVHRDAHSVFYHAKKLSGDAANFRTIDDYYSKDQKTVWLRDEIVQNADAATFEINKDGSEDYDAQDKNNRFKNGKIVAPRR